MYKCACDASLYVYVYIKLVRFDFQEEKGNTENRTISRVEFVPGVDDDRKAVTCRAENPNVTGLFLETSWLIDVVCE